MGDFAESNFMASSGDPDKPFKTYADMTAGILQMHQRYIDPNSAEAKQAVELVEFCQTLDVAKYKKMIQTLEGELGPTFRLRFRFGGTEESRLVRQAHRF